MKTRLLLLLSFFALQGCMFGSGDLTANNEIDVKLRETIKTKNDSLLKAMATSDLKIYKALGSENFVKYLQANIRNVVWPYRNGYLDSKYTIFDEYYSEQSVSSTEVKIPSEEHGYTLSYVNEEEKTYVSLLKTSLYQNDYLLMVIYGLTDKGWKINELEITMFGHYGKTAKDFYELAKKKEEEKFLIDAFGYADLAMVSIEEGEERLKFDDQKRMGLYRDKLKKELSEKYKFPKPIEDIRTQPEILGIETVTTKEGIYPVISYASGIPLKDSLALEDEYNVLKGKVKDIYPDLDFNKKYIYYKACNKLNDQNGNSYMESHDFIDKKDK
jgi:hypothetical protein